MRTDIKFDSGSFTPSFTSSIPQYTMDWTWEREDDYALYGSVRLPETNGLRSLENGIGVRIPFRSSTKKVNVSFIVSDSEGGSSLINNRTNNPIFGLLDVSGDQVQASYLPVYSMDGEYRITMKNGDIYLSDYEERDLAMIESMEQNKRFLLECTPGNLYQYPTTGVGIFRYLNSNLRSSGLAERIKQQFNADKMIVQEAVINQEENSISIVAEEI